MVLIPGLPDDIARECLIRISFKQFYTVSAVCKGWKREIKSRKFHSQRKARGFSQAIVVLTQAVSTTASGVSKHPATLAYRFTLYEPETGEWSHLPPIPGYYYGLPLFCRCAGVGRNLVVSGGWNQITWNVSNEVYVYNFVSATWNRAAIMPGPPRSFFACASDSDLTVYVAGGHDEKKSALRSALAYNVMMDEWVPLADMARHRDECKGIFHGGKFHVIGGYGTEMQGQFKKCGEAFDIATCQWDQVEEDLLQSSTCPKSCVVDEEGKIYMCLQGQLAVLDGATWRAVSELPEDVRVEPCIVTWQGKMLVIGSNRLGGPYTSYRMKLGERTQSTWKKIETPEGFSGHVQTGCSLEM